jgi:hypothetical protein
MACYLISYDLKGRNYKPLWDYMRALGAEMMLPSSWVLRINAPALKVRNAMRNLIGSDDAVAVIEITTRADWALYGTKPGSVDLLRLNSNGGTDEAGNHVGEIIPPTHREKSPLKRTGRQAKPISITDV